MNEEVLSDEEMTVPVYEVSVLETSVAIIAVLLFLWILGGGKR